MTTLTNRQIAVNVLTTNKAVLANEGAKAYRALCLQDIAAQSPAKDVGATFNDAKHILINAGTIEAFGRHGKGRNQNSAPRVVVLTPAEGDKWQVVDKATGNAVAFATSRAKAYAKRTDAETQRIIKL